MYAAIPFVLFEYFTALLTYLLTFFFYLFRRYVLFHFFLVFLCFLYYLFISWCVSSFIYLSIYKITTKNMLLTFLLAYLLTDKTVQTGGAMASSCSIQFYLPSLETAYDGVRACPVVRINVKG